jgi:hypothetical protein
MYTQEGTRTHYLLIRTLLRRTTEKDWKIANGEECIQIT